jgi:hypothetical protein
VNQETAGGDFMTVRKITLGLLVVPLMVMVSAADGRGNPADGAAAIACQVMESHADSMMGVTAVIFHQQRLNDRDALGGFLCAHDGGIVEFRTANGAKHSARMFRLGSCFGRGLLLFSSSAARVSAKDEIRIEQ